MSHSKNRALGMEERVSDKWTSSCRRPWRWTEAAFTIIKEEAVEDTDRPGSYREGRVTRADLG